mgnify:CR=1 FL=1
MSKKELIARLLNKLSEEDLEELLGEEEVILAPVKVESGLHTIKGRGSVQKAGDRKTKKVQPQTQGSGKTEATRQSMDLSGNRPNKFAETLLPNLEVELNSGEKAEMAGASKADSQITPRAKSYRSSSKIDVTCSACKKDFNVSISLVHRADRYMCNNCISGGRS